MAKSINQVILMGRLTRDPEARSTTAGKQVSSFTLAVDRGNDETDFFDITAWEKLSELVQQYIFKGSKVIVMGRLRQDSWDDKETGKKRTRVDVTANDVTFLDNKLDTETKPKDVAPTDIDDKPIDLSEIPF